jgi:anti-anti-sigma factor
MSIQAWSDTIWVVKLANEPALSEDLVTAKKKAELAAPIPHLVLDFSGVTHLNSSNLAQLLRLRAMAITNNTKLRLTNPSNHIWGVFLATGLDRILTFAPDVPTALADVQMPS